MKQRTLHGLLSKRQFETASLVSEGLNNKEIGTRLRTSEHVVKNYLRVIYDKAGCWTGLELALRDLHEEVHGLYEPGCDDAPDEVSTEAIAEFDLTPSIYLHSTV